MVEAKHVWVQTKSFAFYLEEDFFNKYQRWPETQSKSCCPRCVFDFDTTELASLALAVFGSKVVDLFYRVDLAALTEWPGRRHRSFPTPAFVPVSARFPVRRHRRVSHPSP